MKRIVLFSHFLFISFLCFSQQNLPAKIIGKIPAAGSDKKYQIQVGAYMVEKNAQDAVVQLKNIDLKPATEKFNNFTRVLIKEIPANQVNKILSSVAGAGFMEVIIREDTPSKKQENNSNSHDFLCKTWIIENSPNPELTGYQLYILKDGTYYLKNTKGETSSLSNWRWNGGNEFEYSHNNWEYYGRADIINLSDDSFELFDTGYSYDAPGRSSAGFSNRWVFSDSED